MVKIRQIIFLICSIVFLAPFVTEGASLSISPASATFETGERVSVRVIASTDKQLNAISALIAVPSLFTIESVSKSASILNFWVTEPSFSSSNGIVSLEGVALNGYMGNGGVVATVVLRAVKPGIGSISFKSGQILANDGLGTNITGPLLGGDFTVQEAPPKPAAPIAPVKKPEPSPVILPDEVPVPLRPILEPPLISYGKWHGLPAILGKSKHEGLDVVATFASPNTEKIFITGKIDNEGEFSLFVPSALKHGSYEVTAVVAQEDGSRSLSSNVLSIKVGNMFSDVGWEINLIWLLLLICLIALVYRMMSHSKRRQYSDAGMRKKIKEAQAHLHKSFESINYDLKDHSKAVTRTSDDSSIVSEEKRAYKQIKKDLDDAETEMAGEIEDIKSV